MEKTRNTMYMDVPWGGKTVPNKCTDVVTMKVGRMVTLPVRGAGGEYS